MKYLAIAIILAITGCATQPETTWDKPGSTDAQFEQDAGQCDAQAFGASHPSMMQIAIIRSSCLRGKGWKLVNK